MEKSKCECCQGHHYKAIQDYSVYLDCLPNILIDQNASQFKYFNVNNVKYGI